MYIKRIAWLHIATSYITFVSGCTEVPGKQMLGQIKCMYRISGNFDVVKL